MYIPRFCRDGVLPGYAKDIPEDTLRSLDLFVSDHCAPGGFLEALLTNNLFATMRYADDANRPQIDKILMLLWNENVPAVAWMNDDNYAAWLNQRRVD